jgi:hypothetical protein
MQKHGAAKRRKELMRQERQRDKEAKAVERKKEKELRGSETEGVDPDIAGIVPGPQPPPE